ncbi:cation:proton antiporter [Streptomyces sp. MN03-5084-2B]|nr:cation:proton antiporter [Streptomyces sp. MN03-5084-2B]
MLVLGQLTKFLLAVAVIIGICHLLGAVCARLRQPPVIGELAGALLLGPSLLGAVAPGVQKGLFAPGVLSAIDLAGQLGLVVFMFLLGGELRIERLAGNRRTAGLVVAGSITIPFAAGLGFASLVPAWFAPSNASLPVYLVFFGLAISITALPVLARILTDHGAETSATGTLALTVAAIGDGLAWAILTVILAAAGAHDTGRLIARAVLAIVLFAAAFAVVRPVLAALLRRAERLGTADRAVTALLVAGAVAFAAATDAIGLHPIIGAFLFGVLLPREHRLVTRANARLNDFAVVVLLPLFFASVGLKANFAAFAGSTGWLLFGGALAVAVLSKFAGAAGAAALAGTGRRQALRLGALMNCRGITELVIANVGLQQGLITTLGYTIIVLIAIVTTAVTGPLARLHALDDDLLPARTLESRRPSVGTTKP